MPSGTAGYVFIKFVTTFVTTTVTSLLLVLFSLFRSTSYNLGELFIGWFMIFFFYSGLIVLLYGNLISIGLDFIQKKWFRTHDWLYILLHGFFGLLYGLFFQETIAAIYGMIVALFYGFIDKWIRKSYLESKSIKLIILLPIIALPLFWGYFHFTSPSEPPFTKEDAAKFATSTAGTIESNFPQKIGKWQGSIDGFNVERETTVKQIDKETYIVTLTETWFNNTVNGSYSSSYRVDRNSLTAIENRGLKPPYYKK
ncbi:hypothetical protein WAX74_04935 [Psychrobacillus sp. FJAT-51614]|uniref:Uncharacterized protein n=1 Tax=Psychrobacillus mangrovi TaxID=3117745 RepID=A0ABU8F1V0_9BACI